MVLGSESEAHPVRAMVQTDFGGPDVVSVRQVAEPVCGARDVVVKVEACALNRLDRLQREGPGVIPGFTLPHIAGLDLAGVVVATGSAVTSVQEGDRVIADPTQGCRSCPRCSIGDHAYCASPRILGGNIPGALAEFVAVAAESTVQVPAAMSMAAAATLPTAWATAWHSITTVGELAAGETLEDLGLSQETVSVRGASVVGGAQIPLTIRQPRPTSSVLA